MFDIAKVAMVHEVRCKAYREHYAVLFMLCLSWMLSQQVTLTKSCAYFSFENPTPHTNSVEVTENTTVILLFYLNNASCINLENTIISIRRLDITANTYTPQCDIVLKNRECRNSTHKGMYCGCMNTLGAYKFSKIVNKSDITWWKWTIKDGLADDVYVWFNDTSWHNTSVSSINDPTLSISSPETSDIPSEGNTFSKEMLYTTLAVAIGAVLIIIIISIVIGKYVQKRGQGKQIKCSVEEGNIFDAVRFTHYENEPGGSRPINRDNALNDFMDTYYSNT